MSSKCVDAKELYTRDPNLKKKDVEIIQEWLKKQPHLPKMEEMQIILFLHSCYYSNEAAKTALDNYFTVRTLAAETFRAMPPDVLKSYAFSNFINILPKKTPEGYGILMIKLLDTKPENFNCSNFVKFAITVCTLYIHQYGFDNGAVAVFDIKGLSLGHLTRLNLTVIRHALYLVQEGAPVRIKGVHIINSSPVVDKFVTLLKPFLKKQLYEMLQFHSPNSETFYKSVPKECLPEDYGGQSPSIQTLNESNLANMLDNYDMLQWHDSQTVDETKRMGKPKSVNEIFGVEGTFKKLEID